MGEAGERARERASADPDTTDLDALALDVGAAGEVAFSSLGDEGGVSGAPNVETHSSDSRARDADAVPAARPSPITITTSPRPPHLGAIFVLVIRGSEKGFAFVGLFTSLLACSRVVAGGGWFQTQV